MLVDGWAGMNLISLDVIKRLQIPNEDLKPTGTFQGINPGRSQPKGKITLSVTFGRELNYRTEKVVFDVAKITLPYNGILDGVTLRLQHPQDARTNWYHHNPLGQERCDDLRRLDIQRSSGGRRRQGNRPR
jgi:hypothetical protein